MKPYISTIAVLILASLAYAAVPARRPMTMREEVDDLKARVVALEKAVADLKAAQVAKAPADNRFKVGMTIDEADALFTKLGIQMRTPVERETSLVDGKPFKTERWCVRGDPNGVRELYFENGVLVRVVE